jgi:hypothetical protein
MDIAVGPPRPLVTGESYQELEDRLTSGSFHSLLLSLTVRSGRSPKIVRQGSHDTAVCILHYDTFSTRVR